MTIDQRTDTQLLEAGVLVGGLPGGTQGITSAYREWLPLLDQMFPAHRGTPASASGRSDLALVETDAGNSLGACQIYVFVPDPDFRCIATDTSSNALPDRTPRWFTYLKRRLDYLQDYPVSDASDEDAYPKPPEETVKRAWDVACQLFDTDTPTPAVVPADEGGVEFAWHKNGWDLVISALPEETLVWARNRSLGERWSSGLFEQWGRVRSILGTLK